MPKQETPDERQHLKQLITLMPVGERRSRYETRLARLNSALLTALDSQLATLRTERDAVSQEWNRLMDQLESLDQRTPEFDVQFAEWEKIDEQYKRVSDQPDLIELTRDLRQCG